MKTTLSNKIIVTLLSGIPDSQRRLGAKECVAPVADRIIEKKNMRSEECRCALIGQLNAMIKTGDLFVADGILQVSSSAYNKYVGRRFIRRPARTARLDADGVITVGRTLYDPPEDHERDEYTMGDIHDGLPTKARAALVECCKVLSPHWSDYWAQTEEAQKKEMASRKIRQGNTLPIGLSADVDDVVNHERGVQLGCFVVA